MKRPITWLLMVLTIILGLMGGRWLGNSAVHVEKPQRHTIAERPQRPIPDSPVRLPRTHDRPESAYRPDGEAEQAGALSNQRSISFSSAEAKADQCDDPKKHHKALTSATGHRVQVHCKSF